MDDTKLEIDASQFNHNQIMEFLFWNSMGAQAVHSSFEDRLQSFVKSTENWDDFVVARNARKEAWFAQKAAEAEAEERLKLSMAQKKAKRQAAAARFNKRQ